MPKDAFLFKIDYAVL